jgi:spermidine synthase
MTDWIVFHDYIHPSETHLHGLSRVLVHQQTAYQTILIGESPYFGKILVIDGDIQSSQADEYRYHEALVQPALTLHPNPRSVYLAGGGEGATLREILRHPSIESVQKCDIDGEAIALYKTWLPEWHQGSFEDPRVRLFHQDAKSHLASQQDGSFDLILTDLTEPYENGPSKALFSREFFSLCHQKLNQNGVLAIQASQLTNKHFMMHGAIQHTIRQAFPIVRSYAVYIESFDTMWAFVIASKGIDPKNYTKEVIDTTLQSRGLSTQLRYYDGEAHRHLFTLEKDTRSLLNHAHYPIIEDQSPLTLSRKDGS